MEERLLCTQEVIGSIPFTSTSFEMSSVDNVEERNTSEKKLVYVDRVNKKRLLSAEKSFLSVEVCLCIEKESSE